MKNKNAFTLIELLVVIAIIALLLSILLPSLKLAKEKAKTILCKNNLKNYHLAMKMYLHDNGSKYPVSFISLFDGRAKPGLQSVQGQCQWHDRRISPESNPGYAGVLWPYLQTMKTSLCPTFKNFAKHSGHTNCAVDFDPQYSYSQNHFLGGTIGGKPIGVMKETQVKGTDHVLVFVEETIWTINEPAGNRALAPEHILNDTGFWPRHPGDGVFPGDTIATYHGTSTSKPNKGKGNTVFVDGHVDLSDPWDTEVINGLDFRRSYLLAWPKGDARSTRRPY